MSKILRLLFLLLTALLLPTLAACSFGSRGEKYDSLFTLGEGMSYRSLVFKVDKPTRDPYPEKLGELYAYSRNLQGSHVEQCTEAVFEAAKPFTQGLGAVKLDGRWGYIRLLEEEYLGYEFAIPGIYEGAEPFSEGLAAVKLGGRYGYVDPEGRLVIEPRFLSAHYFSDGLAAVETEEGWCFIGRDGAVILPGPFEEAESFTELEDGSLAAVRIADRWGFIDDSGTLAIKPRFEEAWAFNGSGRAAVRLEGRWVLIDTAGDVVARY